MVRRGETVWNWTRGGVIQTILGVRVLRPGEQVVFDGEWDQKDNRGRPVARGVYFAYAVLRSEASSYRTEPSRIVLF